MDELPADVTLWRFVSRSEVRANHTSCGGDTNALVTTPSPVVYFLTNGRNIYVGKTINIHKRWHQHMGFKSNGGNTTHRMRASTDDERLWLVAVVTGFRTAKQALQFEFRCHKFNRKLARSLSYNEKVANNIGLACKSARKSARYINVLYRVLSINKWTTLAVDANTVPLMVCWFDPQYRPQLQHTPGFPYLLPHISEREATPDEKRYIYFFRPGEKREQTCKPAPKTRRRKKAPASSVEDVAKKRRKQSSAVAVPSTEGTNDVALDTTIFTTDASCGPPTDDADEL